MSATDMTTDQTAMHVQDSSSDTSLVRRILFSVFIFLAAWAGAIVTWGVPGLYIPALALVPVMYVILLLISRG